VFTWFGRRPAYTSSGAGNDYIGFTFTVRDWIACSPIPQRRPLNPLGSLPGTPGEFLDVRIAAVEQFGYVIDAEILDNRHHGIAKDCHRDLGKPWKSQPIRVTIPL
jgi:hypothetical protein